MSSSAAQAFYGQSRSGDETRPKLHSTLTGVSSFEAPATGERFVVVRESEFNAMHEALVLAEVVGRVLEQVCEVEFQGGLRW